MMIDAWNIVLRLKVPVYLKKTLSCSRRLMILSEIWAEWVKSVKPSLVCLLSIISQYIQERELRENTDVKRSQNLAELSVLSDRERSLQEELLRAEETIRKEKNRSENYLDQVRKLLNVYFVTNKHSLFYVIVTKLLRNYITVVE